MDFVKVDCVQLPVPELAAGIEFYCGKLGMKLLWRVEGTAGLAVGGDVTELVLTTRITEPEIDLAVPSVPQALAEFTKAGGAVEYGPADIDIGLFAAVRDPFGNRYVLLDQSKGSYVTDADGNAVGVRK